MTILSISTFSTGQTQPMTSGCFKKADYAIGKMSEPAIGKYRARWLALIRKIENEVGKQTSQLFNSLYAVVTRIFTIVIFLFSNLLILSSSSVYEWEPHLFYLAVYYIDLGIFCA